MNQSEWILSLFPQPGFFVEAGAHDGVGDSNTKALEDLGWRGICVEPSDAFKGLQASRKCAVDHRCLWRWDNHRVEFQQVSGEAIELSGIRSCFGDHWDRDGRPHTVRMMPTISLTTLLVEHGAPPVVEFLSLDTEGSELEILRGHDFDRFRFLAIAVEHNGVEPKRTETRQFLKGKGYYLQLAGSPEIEDWFWLPECLDP